ncbi:O-methyltransferase [soil metagenome]
MNRQKAFGQGNPELATYTEELFRPVDAVLERFCAKSQEAGLPQIQVGPMDGRHLEILSRLVRPSRAIEIGTLGGYSGLCIARGMIPGGKLFTFEKSELHAKVARENFEYAKEQGQLPVDFEIFIGSAIENLKKVEDQAPFDLVFIDADKQGYPAYLEWAVQHLRIGGVVIGDNTFAWGEVHRTREKTGNELATIGALHEFNRRLANHPQLSGTILPTAEGLTVGVKVR